MNPESCTVTCDAVCVDIVSPSKAAASDDSCRSEVTVGLSALLRVALLEAAALCIFPPAMVLNLQSSILLLELSIAVRKWTSAPLPEPDRWNLTVLRVLWICGALTLTTALCTAWYLLHHFCAFRAFVLFQSLIHLPLFMVNIHWLQELREREALAEAHDAATDANQSSEEHADFVNV